MMTRPRAKRHSLYYLDVLDARSGALLGQAVDISVTGISITSETALPCPAKYLLRILVPDAEGKECPLEFEAESRWSHEHEGSHTIGFHIGLLTTEQQDRIETLVHAFGYSKIGELKINRAPVPEEASGGGLRRLIRSLFAR